MSKMWDIAQYVEANPRDHDQRWRLCKKLYQSKEYRLALEHLQVLKNEWEDRKRVRRYLAATYYRLEQYKEGIAELNEAINIWPEEIALREQLAQLYFKSGDLDSCANTWGKISEIDPKHKHAENAAMATRAQARGEKYEQFDTDALGEEMDQGFGMSVELSCAQCNAKNSDEFDRCWNCHAPLGKGGSPAPKSEHAVATNYRPLTIENGGEHSERGRAIWILLGCAGIMALLWVFLVVPLLFQPVPESPAMTLDELLATHLSGTRFWVASILLVLWTFLLAISVDIFFRGIPSRIPESLCLGFCMGALAFVLTGLPLPKLMLAFIIPSCAALPFMVLYLPKKPLRIIGAWALHTLLVFVFLFVCLTLVEHSNTGLWFNPIREYNSLLEYQKLRGADPHPDGRLIDAQTPFEIQFRLEETGSAWLDVRAKAAVVNVEHELGEVPLRLEVETEGKTFIFEKISDAAWSSLTDKLVTGTTFTMRVSAEDNKTVAPVKVNISSLLFLKH